MVDIGRGTIGAYSAACKCELPPQAHADDCDFCPKVSELSDAERKKLAIIAAEVASHQAVPGTVGKTALEQGTAQGVALAAGALLVGVVALGLILRKKRTS